MSEINEILGTQLIYKGSLIANHWRDIKTPNVSWQNASPANLDWVFPQVNVSYDHVDEAVECAQKAFSEWKYQPLEERIKVIRRFKEELSQRQEFMAKVIALETGKPLDEARGEAAALGSKIDVTIEHGLGLIKTQILNVDPHTRSEIHWRPKGVLVVIGPFNFPVHLNHGLIVPALLTGNVCVLKPSEKTPFSAQIYMEAARAALPAGVLQLCQGDANTATKLIRHVGINGVLATCSYEIGCKIQKELAEKPRKIVALEMGGKNAALVWKPDNLDKLADDLIRSGFLTTGQRCSALSRIYVERSVIDILITKVHERAKQLVINHPFAENPKPFMGPLISAKAVENFLRYSKMGETEEGGRSIMRPKVLEKKTKLGNQEIPEGYYVTPSINYLDKWDPKSAYQNHEIFGPDIFFAPIDSVEEGIQAVNSNPYGLAFSFFGGDEALFDYVADRVDAGVLYWNRPTVGASARLPFGGWGRSGNHRPAGLFAIFSSNQVQARSK